MRTRVIAFVLFCMGAPATVWAQKVEMVFTPGVAEQAVALKGALKVDKANVTWFGALALVGAPADRKKAYADAVSKNNAVVVLGEDALKAVSEIEFTVPVIVVNAAGRCAARSRVIRVYDSAAAPPDAAAVDSAPAIAEALKSGKSAFKGTVATIVQALLEALK